MKRPQILILGGGPGGLSAGTVLHRAGLEVSVVEKAPVVGGLTRTVVKNGFRFDLGGHRFYTQKRAVFDFVAGLLGDDLLRVPRLSRIHFRGRFVDYPIRPLNALLNVGPVTSLKIAWDLLGVALRRKARAPRSLQDWMESNYGRTLFETYFKVYAEKVWGMPADRIHPDLAAQRVKGLDLIATVANALWPRRRRAESMVEAFHYPRLGYGQICERMALELGPAVLLETQPIGLRHEGDRIVGADLRASDGRRWSMSPEHVVSSIPIPVTVGLLDPPPPPEVVRAASGLRFRAVVFVAVFVDAPSVRPESWIYLPSPEISFGRITEPRNWSAAMAPEGKTSVVAEHFCDPGDPTWSLSDEEIAARTVRDLTGVLGFFRPEQVIDCAVVRAAAAYPCMDTEHTEKLRVVEEYLDRFVNLQVIGRGGMFRYHNTDHVIETAFAAAGNILGEAADIRAINTELTYHEERRPA